MVFIRFLHLSDATHLKIALVLNSHHLIDKSIAFSINCRVMNLQNQVVSCERTRQSVDYSCRSKRNRMFPRSRGVSIWLCIDPCCRWSGDRSVSPGPVAYRGETVDSLLGPIDRLVDGFSRSCVCRNAGWSERQHHPCPHSLAKSSVRIGWHQAG